MLLHNVFLKTIRDSRRSMLLWAIGMAALAAYMLPFFDQIKGAAGLQAYIDTLPKELLAAMGVKAEDFLASPEGFLNAELYGFMVPLLFLGIAIYGGASATAGEEERGTLDWLVAHPIPRWRVFADKVGALLVALAVPAVALWVGFALARLATGIQVDLGLVAAATTSGMLLALAFGGFALALGSLTGSRGTAAGVASAVAIVAYLVNSFAALVDWLEPAQKLSPFYYYIGGDPMRNGLNLGHAAVLLALGAGGVAIALVGFQRRDLT